MKTYTCGKGETLFSVAEKYQMDPGKLFSYNQHIQDPYYPIEGTQITLPSIMGVDGLIIDENGNKGNVCAYVADEPVSYKPINVISWPSQDPSAHGKVQNTHTYPKYKQAIQTLPASQVPHQSHYYRYTAPQVAYPAYQYHNGYYYPYHVR